MISTAQAESPPRPRVLPRAVVLLLGLYSAALIITEFMTSQDYVRHFVTDISGPVPLYAVNTTLSVACLWGAALLFLAASHVAVPDHRLAVPTWWLALQCLIFAFLGCDDRFKIHETLGAWLDVGDHYILLAVAGVEGVMLTFAWSRNWFDRTAVWCLTCAGVLFGVMLAVDALAPHDLMLRLSVEDVAKTWSCLCFLRFAWLMMFARIRAASAVEQDDDAYVPLRRQVSLVAASDESH